MITNFEVEAFLTSMRDEEPEVQGVIRDLLKVVDNANNPSLAGVRKRLRDLMLRDVEIGKHQRMWTILAPWLEESSEATPRAKSKTKVIEELGVTPP